MTDIERNWWDAEAHLDERYATLAWGGDGTPEAVQPTIDMILENIMVLHAIDIDHRTCEIGCGPGRILHRVARIYPDVQFVGIDVSASMIALGDDDRPDNVTTMVVDPTQDIDAGQFDFIYTVEVLQHLTAPMKRKYMDHIKSMLTTKGLALIQYVEGIDDNEWMNHPESMGNMQTWVREAGLKITRAIVPNKIHDEWRWMVIRK